MNSSLVSLSSLKKGLAAEVEWVRQMLPVLQEV